MNGGKGNIYYGEIVNQLNYRGKTEEHIARAQHSLTEQTLRKDLNEVRLAIEKLKGPLAWEW